MHFFHPLVRRESEHYRPLFAESILEQEGLVEPGALIRLLDQSTDDPKRTSEVFAAVEMEGWLRGLLRHKPEPVFNVNPELNHEPHVRILW